MKSPLTKQVVALIGGAVLLYVAASFCGITKILFSSDTSSIGGIILLFACRSWVRELVDRVTAGKEKI
jgi:hypothetical protein